MRAAAQVLEVRQGLEDGRGGTDLGLELGTVVPGDAEEFADHRDREGEGELAHHVDAPAPAGELGHDVEKTVAQGHDVTAQCLDRVGREGAGHESTQARVVGGIEREHRLSPPEELEEFRRLVGRDAPSGEARPSYGFVVGSLPELRRSENLLTVGEACDDPIADGGAEHRSVLPERA